MLKLSRQLLRSGKWRGAVWGLKPRLEDGDLELAAVKGLNKNPGG